MSADSQRTISGDATLDGVGVHSGEAATLTFRPAEPNTGIRFRRVDLDGCPVVRASIDNVVDTDLGERIVHLQEDPPSHIVLPAIHLKKEDVGELFHEHLGTDEGASDPNYLTEAARGHLREKFMGAKAGLSGVNFGVAETGAVVVCTNEGNADLGISLPPLHIASMGIEKLVPRAEDLGVFLRLLARSASQQAI